jgi:hypothetical protein
MAEQSETIAVIDVGNATSLCQDIEDTLKNKLGGSPTALHWQIKTTLSATTTQATPAGEPVHFSGAAVLVRLEGTADDVTSAQRTVDAVASHFGRTVRFLLPGAPEFERRRMSFTSESHNELGGGTTVESA